MALSIAVCDACDFGSVAALGAAVAEVWPVVADAGVRAVGAEEGGRGALACSSCLLVLFPPLFLYFLPPFSVGGFAGAMRLVAPFSAPTMLFSTRGALVLDLRAGSG